MRRSETCSRHHVTKHLFELQPLLRDSRSMVRHRLAACSAPRSRSVGRCSTWVGTAGAARRPRHRRRGPALRRAPRFSASTASSLTGAQCAAPEPTISSPATTTRPWVCRSPREIQMPTSLPAPGHSRAQLARRERHRVTMDTCSPWPAAIAATSNPTKVVADAAEHRSSSSVSANTTTVWRAVRSPRRRRVPGDGGAHAPRTCRNDRCHPCPRQSAGHRTTRRGLSPVGNVSELAPRPPILTACTLRASASAAARPRR